MNRREWLRNAAILAAGVVAADQLELVERLTHRKVWAGGLPSAPRWANIMDYGPMKRIDGTIDITHAWRRAMAALPNGGTIRLPTGRFSLTSPIDGDACNRAGVGFRGEGSRRTIICA